MPFTDVRYAPSGTVLAQADTTRQVAATTDVECRPLYTVQRRWDAIDDDDALTLAIDCAKQDPAGFIWQPRCPLLLQLCL